MIEIALKNINGKDVPAVTSLQVAEALPCGVPVFFRRY